MTSNLLRIHQGISILLEHHIMDVITTLFMVDKKQRQFMKKESQVPEVRCSLAVDLVRIRKLCVNSA